MLVKITQIFLAIQINTGRGFVISCCTLYNILYIIYANIPVSPLGHIISSIYKIYMYIYKFHFHFIF